MQSSPRNAPETVKKLSDAAFEREENISEETKANRSAKISEANRGVQKSRTRCKHCSEEFAPTAFNRYHGDNCIERTGLSDICDDEGNLLTWSKANKQKHKAINQTNEDKRKESREIVAKWVRKECDNKTPNEKSTTLIKIKI